MLAIKHASKGQAQEIALHMGVSASVADIQTRFEMMVGDFASKITRKDSFAISPNNYDVTLKTQFWSKMVQD